MANIRLFISALGWQNSLAELSGLAEEAVTAAGDGPQVLTQSPNPTSPKKEATGDDDGVAESANDGVGEESILDGLRIESKSDDSYLNGSTKSTDPKLDDSKCDEPNLDGSISVDPELNGCTKPGDVKLNGSSKPSDPILSDSKFKEPKLNECKSGGPNLNGWAKFKDPKFNGWMKSGGPKLNGSKSSDAKNSGSTKPSDSKSSDAKNSGSTKSSDSKSSTSKPDRPKLNYSKSGDSKMGDWKYSDTKSKGSAKASDSKRNGSKPNETNVNKSTKLGDSKSSGSQSGDSKLNGSTSGESATSSQKSSPAEPAPRTPHRSFHTLSAGSRILVKRNSTGNIHAGLARTGRRNVAAAALTKPSADPIAQRKFALPQLTATQRVAAFKATLHQMTLWRNPMASSSSSSADSNAATSGSSDDDSSDDTD